MSKNHLKKCNCGQKDTYGFCRKCSRIKMVILFKNGFKSAYGGNKTRYSYVKYNNRTDRQIIDKLFQNNIIQKNIMQQAIGAIQFYNNFTNSLIEEYK